MTYRSEQLMFFLIVYGFLAWAIQVVFFAVKEKKFVNRGLLTLPINLEIGIVFVNLVIVLPTLGRNYFGMYLLTFANLVIMRAILGFLSGRLTKNAKWLEGALSGTPRNFLFYAVLAGAILLVYLLLQPMLMVLAEMIPALVLKIVQIVVLVLLGLDFLTVLVAVKKGKESFEQRMKMGKADEAASRIAQIVWKRLEKAYPGISDEEKRSDIIFAKGMNLDKIVWVFLISAFLGDLIEMVFCRVTGGTWMSRSSVVFGTFSFVWGIGAVVLTVSLMRLKDKNDRWILFAGAILGGAFEYICSVFTEVVFGKVFWDYSQMPLNIGGRTNLLYMFFWGILGLFWVKIAYPPLDRFIEKFPPIAAKVCTWVIIFLMALNALFTVEVLLRYNERKVDPAPSSMLEEFIDSTYNDDFVEKRWKNMVSTDEP